MDLYWLFLIMATLTVLSPGPGVVMTLSNSLRYGFMGSLGGIFGIAFGTLLVASISASSVGVILATSAVAFTALKLLGAAYLFYLGIRLWRSPSLTFAERPTQSLGFRRRFLEGLTIQLTNPKAVFFFLSVFPQFINPQWDFTAQFTLLVLTYSTLVIVIHCLYAFFGQQAKGWFRSPTGARVVNRIGGATFMCFGAALASAKR
ncbi:LysE family translocator [Chromohalobacter nigrandesensis]|uniref:LysE family translocator n=1 Tax=Chromohalobacter nigrandesensis TaxID=119863 RepID=UPI001FF2BA4A|nr:LysE family transporter [Chromohalobacter nigrandesensis]MCK0745465.1 LysE family transporter [Chromohalobacter nigrandesensis]